MIKKKILIFGKNSFIGSNLFNYLKDKHNVSIKSYNKDNLKKLNDYDYIINCSTNKNYIKKKYSKVNDYDLNIVKRIKNYNSVFILLSSRKIYQPKSNITENSEIKCLDNYAKNKFITEAKILKFRPKKIVVLRISNLIGFKKKNLRRIHFTYIDYLLKQIKKKKLADNKKKFKDFLDISTFVKIIHVIIKKKVIGIYNVSIGQKIFLNEINKWILYHYRYKNKLNYINLSKNTYQKSFFLNNSKLKKKIRIKISKKNLKKECISLSKKLFFSKAKDKKINRLN